MPRRPLIAGNWKMYKTISEATSFVEEIIPDCPQGVEVAIAPPFTALYAVSERIKGSLLKLAAQDVFWENEGAYTGEISPIMLKDIGCDYVIIGHSERRSYFFEDNEAVKKKVSAAIRVGLVPILCVGERIEERKGGKTFEVVKEQMLSALNGISLTDKVVIAYEPVWAIGTGLTATPEQAQEVHGYLRQLLCEEFGKEFSESVRILYGGSVKPENISGLMEKEDIDGALVGGASLKASTFLKIVNYGRI